MSYGYRDSRYWLRQAMTVVYRSGQLSGSIPSARTKVLWLQQGGRKALVENEDSLLIIFLA
jgi:hypothetical protein